uniref:Protein ALP1-like isoform X1 n=1 Tax=Tanacetum cinerariifolium TaxID=118510 RepID=A0A6L2N5W0_TANCI|nr:protein ALP1-like isoform X1 [Tanacetum cinerariifolium]
MMSDSDGGDLSDVDDFDDLEMIMQQVQSEQQEKEEGEREWRNCPKAWHGQFARGDKKYPTRMLEAVASNDLRIWHAFFWVAGANNDLTVLNNSSLFDDLLDDIAPVAPFEFNGVTFGKGYYLADGIYPQWSSFVKSFTVANSEKNALFKRKQESA